MEAGVLGGQPRSKKEFEGMPVLPASLANREPVFKLTWASFPSPAEMKALATQPEGSVPVTTATAEYSDRGETLLFVLGGQSEGEKPGINMLQFPAYQQPLPSKTKTNGSPLGDGLSLPVRAAFRDSLYPSGSSNYATRTPPEDFFLLPRNSPYFNMAHDPVTLFMLLTPDARLPKLDKSAERQLVAYTCPPPRSTAPPPVLSRKNYATPGAGENIIAMTPAPLRQTTSPVRTTPGSGWRFPWSASPTTTISNAPFSPISSVFAIGGAGRRKQRLPSQIWSGGMSVLGTSLISLPTPTFKRLIAWSIDNAGIDMAARVPLRGGLAVPDLQSHGAPDVKVIKMECYRLLVTWHADCTVRFWDMSPHVLVLPTPLRFEYPNPMSHLTINIGEWLRHPDIAHLPLAQLWATDRSKVQVASVQLSRETLECVVTFVTGEVLVTRFDEATMDSEDSHHGSVSVSQEDDEDRDMGYFPPQPRTDIDYIDEITEIDQLANHTVDGFKPLALFAVKRGEVVSCAVSDIGEVAMR
jgi:hypothetical protein